MKSLIGISKTTILAALALFIFSFQVAAQNLKVAEKQIVVEGTSTLHDWTAEATEVTATGTVQLEGNMLKGLQNFTVRIPVEKLESSKGGKMNRNMYKALKSDEHPTITFKVSKLASIKPAGDGIFDIKVEGQLTIAGKTQNVTMDAAAEMEGGGKICFSGNYKLNMTNYDVEPPSFMFGAMSTGEEVTIVYSITVQQ